jgi:CelD/BcsL family acetyltransferase involved in cellulose biosynthesis
MEINDTCVMKVELYPGNALPTELVTQWCALTEQEASYDSPFFRPEFMQRVAAVRTNVEVAVLSQAGRVVGFFPFERNRWNIAHPLGDRMNDFHGCVVEPETNWSSEALLRGCKLRGWVFEHILQQQTQWQPHIAQTHAAPFIDISQGFDEYYRLQRSDGGLRIVQFLRKLRKIEREIGPVRFVPESREPALWNTLLQWKDQQYRRQQLANPLQSPGYRSILESMLQANTPGFSGYLSALYAGEQLAAVLLSIRSRSVWHYWIPAYNVDLYRYSPGSLLLMRMVTDAQSLGVERIDLGAGHNEYKDSFATGTKTLAEGAMDTLPGLQTFRSLWRHSRDTLKKSQLYGYARRPIRWMRSTLDHWNYG